VAKLNGAAFHLTLTIDDDDDTCICDESLYSADAVCLSADLLDTITIFNMFHASEYVLYTVNHKNVTFYF